MLNNLGKFTVTASNAKIAKRTTVSNVELKNRSNIRVATATGSNINTSRKMETAAAQANTSLGEAYSGGITANSITYNTSVGMIDGIVDTSKNIMYKMFRDMYYYDSIAGSAVDMLSNMPFSDFSLSGVNDPSILEVYTKSIENMRLQTLLPGVAIDYLVMGAFIASMNFDRTRGYFDSIAPHNIEFCSFVNIPVYGMDPLINLRFSEETCQIFTKGKDPRLKDLLESLPEEIQTGIKSGKPIPLDPSNTVHIPRRTFATDNLGVSYFKRLIPIHVLEKALLRGTIDQAYRRQRSVLHITVGDMEWEPNDAELNAISGLFLNADLDPLNAVIATRQGISPAELKQGGEFWKYNDIYDFTMAAKLRGMGLSEQLLSGDASYNTMESSLSVFMEQQRAFRERITNEFFYEKMFPSIAVANDFLKSKYRHIEHGSFGNKKGIEELWGIRDTRILRNERNEYIAMCTGASIHDINSIEDITKYLIPTINWHKQLKPSVDREYFDLLTTLTEKGVPIPLRILAAAGGQDIDEILNQLDSDVTIRKELDAYNKKIAKFKPAEEKSDEFSGLLKTSAPGPGGVIKKVGVLNREFDEKADKLTRKLSRKGKSLTNNKINKLIAEAATEAANKEKDKIKKKYTEQHEAGNRVTHFVMPKV